MKQRESVLKSVKHLLDIYDRRLEALRQRPVPLDVREKETKRISKVIASAIKQAKREIQQEETHNG